MSETSRLMLLIARKTPQTRVEQHVARLAKSFRCPPSNIEVKLVDAKCEEPSKLIQPGVWLYADSEVGSLSQSLKLARDWQTKWFFVDEDVVGSRPPLYRCKVNPHGQRRRR